jgi:ABC-type microcin C transport system duplicated ATPase subunit YejF
MVMRHGKLLESGRTETLWSAPVEDYTRELLATTLIAV